MTLAITEEHQEFARAARSFLEANRARSAGRALLEAREEKLPDFWKALAELGWLGLHIPEEYGGQGFALPELAVVLEQLGYALAPGPFLPTVLAAAVIDRAGSEAHKRELLPGLSAGSTLGAVGLDGSLQRRADGSLAGSAGLVLGAHHAHVLLLPVGGDLFIVQATQDGLRVSPRENVDRGRRVAGVRCEGVEAPEARRIPGGVAIARQLGWVFAAAEASGGARACTEMAAAYAQIRIQFGRPIGTFQAVKHHCANMLVDAEQATAAAWDAARAQSDPRQAELASAVAASLALPAFVRCAQLNIQVHGGIGYTWEHDAHLYLRRAAALAAVFGPAERAHAEVTRLAAAGVRRELGLELPPEAAAIREEVRGFVARYRALPAAEQRKSLADSGYLMPHWPRPWGRGASAVEQLVIDEEFAGVERTNLGISGWVTLTIAQHGTPQQIERWVRPSMEGEIEFCQLFSEPNAGSDAAGIQTRGIRVEGGWLVSGQKVWTSGAQSCNRGFATVRTDPHAGKHQGISMMVIDMRAKGVDVRPLRQLTGHSHFNEVFFDGVFVPDQDVVGPVNQGWVVARSTLGNERVSIGGARATPRALLQPLAVLAKHAPDDPGVARQVGALIAEEQVIRLLNLRHAARALAGGEPGPEGNVTKLLGSEHGERVASLCASLIGSSGAVTDGAEGAIAMALLAARGMTIAGGTSEIARNQIAERILGLPRDPLLR